MWFVSFALDLGSFVHSQRLSEALDTLILLFCWCCSHCLSPHVQYIRSCFPNDRLFPSALSHSLPPALSISLNNTPDLFTFVLFVCFDTHTHTQHYRIVPNDDIFCGQFICIFKLHALTLAHSRSCSQSSMPVIIERFSSCSFLIEHAYFYYAPCVCADFLNAPFQPFYVNNLHVFIPKSGK